MSVTTRRQTAVPSPLVSYNRTARPDVPPYQRYQGLATTIPDRHKEAFPGLAAHAPKDPLRWVHSAALILSLGESGLVNLYGESWTAYHKRVPEQRLCGYFAETFLQPHSCCSSL
uniref:Uncharacterized protein n=1 Tax=Trichuris muris TaxID=70415 RepID=A0A5S6QHM7_TRIMR